MSDLNFAGPVFIVGLPRSGTKLLRDLMNRNPAIGIPEVETHFIPFMINQFGEKPDFTETANFDRFFAALAGTTFYWNMKMLGKEIHPEDIENRGSWASVIEDLLRYCAPYSGNDSFIFGDKTPGYINHIALLLSLFPNARFVHIIRDPRDECLSVRNVWGKHLYRSASTWAKTIAKVHKSGLRNGQNYVEVHYEQLLDTPENVLQGVCDFLGCPFEPAMTELEKPADALGDTTDQRSIVRENQRKFEKVLKRKEIKRVEEITFPVATKLGYQPMYASQHIPPSPSMLRFLRVHDGFNSAKFHMRQKGVVEGLKYFSRLHRQSSWR